MTTLRAAARQALEALEESEQHYGSDSALRDAIQILRAALEQPEQCREWQGLTEEEREAAIRWAIDLENTQFSHTVARAVEAKLKEKNA
jgi:hypothetical protein